MQVFHYLEGKKALVTGGFGFIGSHLVACLGKSGCSVRVLSRSVSKPHWFSLPEVEAIKGDLRDFRSIEGITEEVDLIFHLASLKFAKNPKELFRTNAEGTANLIKDLKRHGKNVKKLVLCSSLSAHGPSPDGRPVREEDTPSPVSYYGLSKLRAEEILEEELKEIPFTIVRPPAVYGPGDMDLLPLFQMAKRGFFPLVGGKNRVAEICHVNDVVKALVLAADPERANGEVLFICGERPYTWEDVADILSGILGTKIRKIAIPYPISFALSWASDLLLKLGAKKPVFVPRDRLRDMRQRFWLCSSEKALRIIGYRPEVTLEEGLKETLTWYERHGLL